MRAAIIGGGFAGNIHAEALSSLGGQIAAVVTTKEDTAESFAKKWNVPVWGTDPALAFADGIDAVHICTPPTSHGHYVLEALKAGKHVFCEKPLSFDQDEAEKLAAVSETGGRICALTYNVRYHMAVQKARELIRSGRFGRPLLIHGSYLQEFHALPAPYDWRYDPSLSGSMRAVTEIGSHWIDTAQYVSGRNVTDVSASFGRFFPERVVRNGMMEAADGERETGTGDVLHVASEDAACVTFRYEDGAIGNVCLSEISPGRGNYLSIEITCEKGNLWWNEEDNNVLHTAKKGDGVRSDIFAFGNGFSDTFASLMRNFYRAVLQASDRAASASDQVSAQAGEPAEYPTFREGARIVRICEAIRRSAERDAAWIHV